MFSKEKAKELRTEFWSGLAEDMTGKKPKNLSKVPYLNYKTGVKDFYIRMHADKRSCMVSFDFQHPDEGIRSLYYEQFEGFKTMLHNTMGTEFTWDPEYVIDGRNTIARVYIRIEGVNLFDPAKWPEMYAFLGPNMIKADEFWEYIKDVFLDLQS
jgi:hypothetical protein